MHCEITWCSAVAPNTSWRARSARRRSISCPCVGSIQSIAWERLRSSRTRRTPAGFTRSRPYRAVNTILADFIYVDGRPIDRCTLISLENRLLIEGWYNPAAFETTITRRWRVSRHSRTATILVAQNRTATRNASRSIHGNTVKGEPSRRRFSGETVLSWGSPDLPCGFTYLRRQWPFRSSDLMSRFIARSRHCVIDGSTPGGRATGRSGPSPSIPGEYRLGGFGRDLEWVLRCSAMERLLGARSSAADTASKLAAALSSDGSLGPSASETVQDWAEEFYRPCNDFAHGKIRTRQPRTWHQAYHLLLAAIVFPLLVKKLLEREAFYQSTETN